ncbi:MAG: hypothetical protein IPJ59_12270 [Nannocystis sp.]|nr:hypothetical protein [Nannocystis sp.]
MPVFGGGCEAGRRAKSATSPTSGVSAGEAGEQGLDVAVGEHRRGRGREALRGVGGGLALVERELEALVGGGELGVVAEVEVVAGVRPLHRVLLGGAAGEQESDAGDD